MKHSFVDETGFYVDLGTLYVKGFRENWRRLRNFGANESSFALMGKKIGGENESEFEKSLNSAYFTNLVIVVNKNKISLLQTQKTNRIQLHLGGNYVKKIITFYYKFSF